MMDALSVEVIFSFDPTVTDLLSLLAGIRDLADIDRDLISFLARHFALTI